MNLNDLEEKDFKKYLIDHLNKINSGWVDGDKSSNLEKTVDLLNQSLKIAIEIKDDTTYKHEFPPITGEIIVGGLDLNNKSEQLKSDAKDANKKFRNYPNFKTILLIRTELINIPYDVIGYIFGGLKRFAKKDKDLIEIGRKNKFLSFTSTKEVGSYLLFGNGKYYYVENPNANLYRVIAEDDIEKYFSEKIHKIQIQ